MAQHRTELGLLQDLCIQKIKDAYNETLQHGERQRKIAQLQAKKTAEAIHDAKQAAEAKILWHSFIEENKRLSETSVKTYDTFTSLMCTIGNLAVLLNLSIQAEEPLKHVTRWIMERIKGDVTQLTPANIRNIENRVAEYDNDLRNGNIQIPELTYSIFENGTLRPRLDIPARMNMSANEITRANTLFGQALNRWRENNEVDPTNEHAFNYDAFQHFLEEQNELHNLHLNFHTLDPRPAPAPAPAI